MALYETVISLLSDAFGVDVDPEEVEEGMALHELGWDVVRLAERLAEE